ncbi:MAG: FtsX-like permease family protein [Methylovirgula sp.]|jgi:putative ABC transport system permease protein
MSLVFTLASRNLFQDRLRFVASLIGIVLSVVLVMVQMGLYFGFGRMITTVIDHVPTDLWIVSNGVNCVEDLSLLKVRMQKSLMAIDGVTEAVPVVVGFSGWSLPDGAMTPVFIIGSDVATGGLSPWDVVEGTVQSLTTPGTVAVDRSYSDRLAVSGVGTTSRIRGLAVKVGVVTDGIRSFTTTPYVFTDLDGARSYVGLPANFTSYFLVRLKPKADVERIRQNILSNMTGIQALTPEQFRQRSRSFWLFGTGAGAALLAGVILSAIVGTAVVAQTLFSSTKDHLYEFATLRAIGASNGYIYEVIICQAVLSAVIGFAIAALIGTAIVHFTAKSALQIMITPGLMIELFLVTVVMCVVSAFAAILRVIRVDPAIVLNR